MRRGRPSHKHIVVSPRDTTLLAQITDPTCRSALRVRRRAHFVLLVTGGMPIRTAGITVGLSNRHAHKWLDCWCQYGIGWVLHGLYRVQHPRCPPVERLSYALLLAALDGLLYHCRYHLSTSQQQEIERRWQD